MIKYSEIFFSPQGEGHYVGQPSVWLRFFMCNLQCEGFGQKDPTDKESYILPYKEVDVSKITRLEEIPVLKYGCDSAYSWAAKFKHLQHEKSPASLAEHLIDLLPNKWWGDFHFCVTGGEPLLKANQKAFIDLWHAFEKHPAGVPRFVTFETNATQPLITEFQDLIRSNPETEFFFSLSPKLFSVSGEKDVVIRHVIKQYNILAPKGQLKFVVNGSDECWKELSKAIVGVREVGVSYPIWVMPVGALKEQQESVGDLVTECCKRGYRVSPRAHAHWFLNTMGT